MLDSLNRKVKRARQFVLHDVWHQELDSISRFRRSLYETVRVGHIVIRDFFRDDLGLQASALTFITLMSMVPMLAMCFAMAKGLGAEKYLEDLIAVSKDRIPEQVAGFVESVMNLVEQTNFLALGMIGLVFLIVTVIKVMGRIELSLNQIWGVKEQRTLMRKLSDYMFVVVSVPLLAIMAFSLNGYLTSEQVAEKMRMIGPMQIIYQLGLRSAGLMGISIALTLLYIFLPNTNVRWKPALIGGFFAGVMWLAWQWLCIRFQIGISNYNKIYGAFAALPISLFWLNVNWMIALLGAEISFAIQNRQTYAKESELLNVSIVSRRHCAYLLTLDICRTYREGESHWFLESFQKKYAMPRLLMQDLLHLLQEANVVIQAADNSYMPAKDMHKLSLKDVDRAVEGQVDERTERLCRRASTRFAKKVVELEQLRNALLAEMTMDELVVAMAAPEESKEPKKSKEAKDATRS